jgi:hypothetical protein
MCRQAVITALFLVHGVAATAFVDRQFDRSEQHNLPVEARLKYFPREGMAGGKGETHFEKAWKAAEAEKRALSKQEADNKQAAVQNAARKAVLAKYEGLPWVSEFVGKAKPTFVGGETKQPMNAGGLAYKAKELAFFRKKKQDKVDKAAAAVKRQAALGKSNLAKESDAWAEDLQNKLRSLHPV